MHSRTEPLVEGCHLIFILNFYVFIFTAKPSVEGLSYSLWCFIAVVVFLWVFLQPWAQFEYKIELIDNLVLRSDLCPWLRHDFISGNPLPRAVPLSNPPVPRDSPKAAA